SSWGRSWRWACPSTVVATASWCGVRGRGSGHERARREKETAMIGGQSMLMVLGVVLLLFGGKKLPELAGALRKSMRALKRAAAPSPEEREAPPAPRAVTAVACAACRAPVEADWAHCPACGAATRPATAPKA